MSKTFSVSWHLCSVFYWCQSDYEACVFICSYQKPQKCVVSLPKMHCKTSISKQKMKKYWKTTFPPKLKKFKRVPGIAHLVYFAEFTSSGKVSDGISKEHIIDLKPSLWTSSELPNTGPSCLPFFYSSIPLEIREKEKDYMKKSQELEVVKLEQANLKAEKLEAMLKEKNQKRVVENEQKVIMEQLQEKLVKITELDKELALKITKLEEIDKELAAVKEQQQNDMDYYFSENDRTFSLYSHLSRSGELDEVHSYQLDGTYRKPVDAPICQINGGCDILFYSKKCVSIEITDAPDNHPTENCNCHLTNSNFKLGHSMKCK